MTSNSCYTELDARVTGDYIVHIDYGIGRLTLPEKCAWVPTELTTEERKEAVVKALAVGTSAHL